MLTKMNCPRVPIDRAVNRRSRVVRIHPMQLNHEEFVPLSTFTLGGNQGSHPNLGGPKNPIPSTRHHSAEVDYDRQGKRIVTALSPG